MTGDDWKFFCEFLHFAHGLLEWSDIVSKIVGGPIVDFFQGEDPGSSRLVEVRGVFLNLLAL
jgi:hypothetical protein